LFCAGEVVEVVGGEVATVRAALRSLTAMGLAERFCRGEYRVQTNPVPHRDCFGI
jgi:predicted transcriptional regulator of viral defense system